MIGKLKVRLFGLIFFLGILTHTSHASGLEKADSLFVAQKYTEAFELYQEVFDQGQGSPSMVLKMAFIQEGLKDHVQALYFLHKYYELTSDKSVLHKMEEIANEQNLEGYKVGDLDFFLTNLSRFKQEIQLGLSLMALVLMVVAFRSKQKGRMPIGVPIIQVLLLGCLLMVTNDWLKPNRAIIAKNTTLMSGPSAAAEAIGPIRPGHQVKLLDESDVWIKIDWMGDEAYIRKGRLIRL